jgi:hypothetical protein
LSVKSSGRVILTIVFALASTALLFALAGCGDSTAASKASPSTSSITKAELIMKGDAICRRTDTVQRGAVAAYERKHGKVTAIGEVEKMLAKVALPPIGTEIRELAALGAPDGNELQIKAIIVGFEKALKRAENNPGTLLGTDEGEFAAPDKLAATYGFKDCAKAL